MPTAEYFKHLLVRTPFDVPARHVRRFVGNIRWRRRHPELGHLLKEEDYIDRIVRRVLKPDSNCIDIGCHLGTMLSTLLEVAPRGQHFAFEPVPRKAAWLRKKFPEVQIVEMALSNTSGRTTFFCNEDLSGFSGLRKNGVGATREISVQQARLSDAIQDTVIRFIKIDVEGGELDVLRGGVELLQRDHPVLLFECVGDALNQFGATPRDIHELLRDVGYHIYLMQDFLGQGEPLSLDGFELAMDYPFQALNFVAACGDSASV